MNAAGALITIMLLWGLIGCTTSSGVISKNVTTVTIDHNMDVIVGDSEKQQKAKNETIEVHDKPVSFYAPGKTSVILIPIKEVSKLTLSLPNQDDWRDETWVKSDERRLTTLLRAINDIQNDVKKGNLERAISAINVLKAQYPHLHYLDIIAAGCYVLGRDFDKAKKIVSDLSNKIEDLPELVRLKSILELEAH